MPDAISARALEAASRSPVTRGNTPRSRFLSTHPAQGGFQQGRAKRTHRPVFSRAARLLTLLPRVTVAEQPAVPVRDERLLYGVTPRSRFPFHCFWS